MNADTPASPEWIIEFANTEDVQALPAIERSAASLFPAGFLPSGAEQETLPAAVLHEAQAEGRLFVARERADGGVVGFALVEAIDGVGHLEEIDVDPAWGRRGIGRALVLRACEWARAKGYADITLITFREIPWNAPFYARLGFLLLEEAAIGNAMLPKLSREAAAGFDPTQRCVMRLRLVDSSRISAAPSRTGAASR
ncbi:MAG: GNAT family N-acetyltransferase [Myxococcota bacterium]